MTAPTIPPVTRASGGGGRRGGSSDSTPTPRKALLGRSPALDGLRGFALVWVVTYHFTSSAGPLRGGWIGLDVFFVLSGFLITAMLLDEVRVTGRISLPLFYARRACRLLPALFVMLAVWVVVLLLFHDTHWIAATPNGNGTGDPVDVGPALKQVGIVLTYGVNWIYALGSGSAPIPHLWSLAVEEQFYVVWPFVVLLLLKLPSARRIWPVIVLAAISASLPFLYWNGGEGANRIYFGTDTRAVGMLLGAVAALLWHRRRSRGTAARFAPAVRAWTGSAVVLAILLTVSNVPVKFLLGPAVAALAAMQIVPYLVDRPGSKLARFLDGRVLVWLGQRSYAVYLWHYLWATWLHPLHPAVHIPVGVAASLLCAHLSWKLVEAPALRYGARFRPKRPEAPPAAQRPQREALAA